MYTGVYRGCTPGCTPLLRVHLPPPSTPIRLTFEQKLRKLRKTLFSVFGAFSQKCQDSPGFTGVFSKDFSKVSRKEQKERIFLKIPLKSTPFSGYSLDKKRIKLEKSVFLGFIKNCSKVPCFKGRSETSEQEKCLFLLCFPDTFVLQRRATWF